MEGCSKTIAGAASGLPDDPLVEILSRVPAKSVCRFKCVSKAWRDLIADPDNRKKLRQPVQGLFVEAAQVDEDDVNKLTDISFSFIDLRVVRSVPLDIDPPFSFLRERIGVDIFLLDSCSGLILFGQYKEPSGPLHYTVCNPTTKHWSAVPACGPCGAITHTYLAFDPAISSHFHLVQLQTHYEDEDEDKEIVSLHVYSSEAGTWSQNQIDEQKEEQGQFQGWDHMFKHHCAFVNGFLHLLIWGLDRHHILAVDVQGKARRIITVPGMADGRPWHPFVCYLGQSQGYLHCVIQEYAHKSYEKEKLSIWVLQDYGTQKWVCKSTVNYFDVFGETEGIKYFQVVDIHQDCNVIFFFHEVFCRDLMAYDMDRKEVSVIATFEEDTLRRTFVQYIPCFSESPALTNKH